MNAEELAELRLAWLKAVVFNDRGRMEPCWFGEDGYDYCEGRIEGAHWIKRQAVELVLGDNLMIPRQELRIATVKGIEYAALELRPLIESVWLSAWDPRNGVAACNKHHHQFDGQRMPELVVWRHQVPTHVERFVLDNGLETRLEQKCPTIHGERYAQA